MKTTQLAILGKRRDSDATKEALLAAARAEFQNVGYEAASTRKIALDAGCNVALINRYFRSKIGLFSQVMEACIDLSPLKGLDPDALADALADIALSKAKPHQGFDPLAVAIKSSGSAEAQQIIRAKLGNPMIQELAAIIGGDKADQKAGVVLSVIAGFFVGRVSIGAHALFPEDDEAIRILLRTSFSSVLAVG